MSQICYINHEVILLDASGSMHDHAASVIKVTDALIATLASQAGVFPDQETRISVYAFSSGYSGRANVRCLIWDRDVLRVPSIAGLYTADGGTPLCDAMVAMITDIRGIPVKYGDHTVLAYLVSDGLENTSSHANRAMLPQMIRSVPETWTLAGLVPSVQAKQILVRYGFAPGNVEVWDPSRKEAVEEVGRRIQQTQTVYASARSAGVRSTTSLFQMAAPSVSAVKSILTPLTPGSYYFEEVTPERLAQIENGRIDQFAQLVTGKPYVPAGKIFYEMTKRETIQGNKSLAVVTESDVYMGNGVRAMLRLPEDGKTSVRVRPGRWKDYEVFITTGSFNRKLQAHSRVLFMR
jgi:hypothetical protein